MELAPRIVKPLFWAAVLGAYVLAVLPPGEAPRVSPTDKLDHMLAFVTLAVLGKLAYPRVAVVLIGVLLAGFGALIEFTQMIPAIHRDAELADWIADSAAIVAGLALAFLLTRRRTPTR